MKAIEKLEKMVRKKKFDGKNGEKSWEKENFIREVSDK